MDFPKSTQELLDKYWSAETTPDEEAQLRASFIPEEQSVTAAYFRFLAQERAIAAPVSEKHTRVRHIRLKRVLSVAASIVILVVAGFLLQRNLTPTAQQASTDTFEDPMEAYAEAHNALLLISEKMNTSSNKAGLHLSKTQPYLDIMK